MSTLKSKTALLLLLSLGLPGRLNIGAQKVAEPPTRALPLHRLRTLPLAPAGLRAMATAVGDDYFDGTSPISRVKRHLAAARQAGVKYLRCAFTWNAIEKQHGEFDWAFWDQLVELAARNGIQLIPYVAYTPEWAARDSKEFWKQPPRDAALFGDFMYTIAARYRGRILSWEIWNEPDNKDYWTGSADEFAAMAELAARRIRQADPEAVLVLGGMSYGPQEFFRRLMTEYHIDEYVDVIAIHIYAESWMNERAETVFQQWVPAMERMIQQDHSGAQLWVNEMGYADYRFNANHASVYGNSVFYSYEHTRAYQADMVFKFATMALAADDVALAGWYRLDDFPLSETRLGSDQVNYHLGLFDTRGQPKPAFFALRLFNLLLDRPVRVLRPQAALARDSQAVIEMFERVDHHVILAAWLRSSNAEEVQLKTGMLQDLRREVISVPLPCVPARVRYYDLRGHLQKAGASLSERWLKGVHLRGDQVFIAEFACSTE